MTTEQIIIVSLGALLLSERLFCYLRERSWQRERKELCNRLQAGTLTDYAQHKPVLEPEKPEKVGTGSDYSDDLGSLGIPDVEISPQQLAMGQAHSDSLLEG